MKNKKLLHDDTKEVHTVNPCWWRGITM